MIKKTSKRKLNKIWKKSDDSSIKDKLTNYNIEGSILYNNPIRLINTPEFEDKRDEYCDDIIIDNSYLFESIFYLRHNNMNIINFTRNFQP